MKTDNLYTSKQIRETLNIDSNELAKLRNNNKINFEKVSSRKYLYELNEELTKEFIEPKLRDNTSLSSDEENVERQFSDSYYEFPEVGGSYNTLRKIKKLTSYQKRDHNILLYRSLSQRPEVQNSIEEIVNEALTPFEDGKINKIDFNDNKEIGDTTKKSIQESFDKCVSLLDFNNNSFYLFNDWYIDGILPLECIYDENNMKDGVIDLIKISPVYIRDFKRDGKEYYSYEKNLSTMSMFNNSDIRNSYKQEQIINVGSGLYDSERLYEMSYLNSAIKSINDLAHIENGIIKYRITRASEKNVWNIDIGTMAKSKAEGHINRLARDISSNIKYNVEDGTTNLDSTEGITDDWLFPSRNGKQKTSVETINGNSDFISKLDDLEYFRRKLYEAMKIPVGRLDGDSSLDYSATDILREELKFVKFINRLRSKFNHLFLDFIKKDLIAKGTITYEEWIKIYQDIKIVWNQSNQIVENAEIENLQKRFETIGDLEDAGVIGKYIPMNYIVEHILKMTDKEFKEYQTQIEKEKKAGLYGNEDNE